MSDDQISKGAEAISDLLTMLGVNPDEQPEHGGPTTAETLAAAVVNAAREQPEVVARVNVGLIPDAATALQKLRERTGYKQVDIVNRALQIYEFVHAELTAGSTLVMRKPDGSEQTVKFL